MKERLLQFIQSKGMRVSAFERSVGLSNAYIQNFKGNMSAEKLECILKTYPELNQTWLLTGHGDMINTLCNNEKVEVENSESADLRTKLAFRENECKLMQSNIDALREIIDAQKMTIQSLHDQIEILKQR